MTSNLHKTKKDFGKTKYQLIDKSTGEVLEEFRNLNTYSQRIKYWINKYKLAQLEIIEK